MDSSTILAELIQALSSMRFARDFNLPYETSQIRLDILLLRLMRWGQAINAVATDKSKSHALDRLALDEANAVLGELQADIERYRIEATSWDGLASAFIPEQDLTSYFAVLHAYVQKAAASYGGASEMWAIRDRSRFDYILGWAADAMRRVEELADVDPKLLETRRALCRDELKDMLALAQQQGAASSEVLGALDVAVKTEARQDWDVCFGYEVGVMHKA